jgi:hypothetical protein
MIFFSNRTTTLGDLTLEQYLVAGISDSDPPRWQ